MVTYGSYGTIAIETAYDTTKYILHGKNIVHLTNGSNNLHFFYDAQNRPAIVVYNGTAYGYVHNLQGDIIAIIDSAGTKVVEYKYDAWGKPLSKTGSMASTLGKWNPFRYRSYVYDEETEMIYLRQRFYNPHFQRIISADLVIGINNELFTHNTYAYCENNPVRFIDPNGFSRWFKLRWDYFYRIDYGPDSTHIHIRYKNNPVEWKQKINGEPYEPNHKTTQSDDPPRRLRELLKKIKDDNDKNNKSGGAGGPGWDWDGNKASSDAESNQKQNEFHVGDVLQGGASILVAGGVGYGVYRLIRLIPSFAPPLWWTLPANLAIP